VDQRQIVSFRELGSDRRIRLAKTTARNSLATFVKSTVDTLLVDDDIAMSRELASASDRERSFDSRRSSGARQAMRYWDE
jgi:hypothetical protein